MAQCGRHDLQTAISVLTKQVGEDKTDEDDYKKLTRVAKYMHRTKFLCLTIEVTYLDQNHWFIYAAYAVHDELRSSTGAYATFGKGMIDGSAKGQRINTTNPTEAEVVGVHKNMPTILWIRYFVEAQGYSLRPTKVHHNNLSGRQLKTNKRAPISKQTRYTNTIYISLLQTYRSVNTLQLTTVKLME